MTKYNYYEAVKEDIITAINNDYLDEIIEELNEQAEAYDAGNTDDIGEFVFDALWIDDNVTGNGSGSYWFNTWRAEEALCHNTDLLLEAEYYNGVEFSYEHRHNPEALDVFIRCMVFSEIIWDTLYDIPIYCTYEEFDARGNDFKVKYFATVEEAKEEYKKHWYEAGYDKDEAQEFEYDLMRMTLGNVEEEAERILSVWVEE